VLADGRLAGLVVAAETEHQQRRLYVVLVTDVLAHSAGIARALAAMVGGPAVMEVRDAPLYRDVLQNGCLAPDGTPVLVRDAGYKAFGVKPADLPGEPKFLDYVPRDADQKLHDGLRTAQARQRMLLVVGGSAGGKSRSAAEAARRQLPGHRLLCPRETSLARLRELPAADLGPALVWLDDVERYNEPAFRDTVERLLSAGLVVVATIRRSELEAREPKGDLHKPFGEALTDAELVVEVDWRITWNDQERQRVAEHVRYPALLAWVAAGKSPGAWVVAGPQLQAKLRRAKENDERPARYALARTVLDWYRTGIAQPIPLAAATSLLQVYLPDDAEPAATEEIEDALNWGLGSITGALRTKQSLLAKIPPSDALTVHDYIQDADARASAIAPKDPVWLAALDEAASEEARFAIGLAACDQDNTAIALKSWLALARKGMSEAMFNLGVLLEDSDKNQAREWYERAAQADDASAMYNLGLLLEDSDKNQARKWWQQAAQAGHAAAMNNLGILLEDSDKNQARKWWQQAAQAGHADAMNNLGILLEDSDKNQAREWYERAAQAGHADAMYNLGLLLEDSDKNQARKWWQQAARAGHADAMSNLGVLLEDSDKRQARKWWQRAARAGHEGAMFNLGLLLEDSDKNQARKWWQQAARAGHHGAMNKLGVLLHRSHPEQARHWYEQAAQAGHADAMFNLGLLLEDSDKRQARKWWQQAAKAGHEGARFKLKSTSSPRSARRPLPGRIPLEDSDPDQP